jgi:hypothetical protein
LSIFSSSFSRLLDSAAMSRKGDCDDRITFGVTP